MIRMAGKCGAFLAVLAVSLAACVGTSPTVGDTSPTDPTDPPGLADGGAEHPDPSPAASARNDGSSPPNNPVPNDPVALRHGVVSTADRVAFCTEVARCKPSFKYGDCMDYATTSAVVDFARPGCQATDRLLAAAGCQRAVDLCSDKACDAVIQSWWDAAAGILDPSSGCYLRNGELGIGDSYTPLGLGDSMCQGVRTGGGWCGAACAGDSACLGKHAGLNAFGTENLCGPDTNIGGKGCYPACRSTQECVDWYGVTSQGSLRNVTCRKIDDFRMPVCVANTTKGVEQP